MPTDFTFLRPDGTPLQLSEFRGRTLVLIALRHLACISCRAHVKEAEGVYDEIKAANGEVLLISFSSPERVAQYRIDFPLPFLAVADPEMKAYRELGMGRMSPLTLLRPHVTGHYLALMMRGWKPKGPSKGDDVMQLGGDFVIDASGNMVYAHPCKDPSDRPSANELLAIVRKLKP